MKNLKRLFSAHYEFEELKGSDCFCVGVEENIAAFNKSGLVYCYNNGVVFRVNGEKKEVFQMYDLRSYYGSCNNFEAVSIEYQYLAKTLVLALVNGDVFSLELETNDLQCIGSVDSGLKAMEWSPDFETVVFATGQNTVILMSGSFDPINEINLFDTGPGVKQMVNVGWGKKETQFHGSEGKAARTAAPVEGSKDIDDDLKTRISWRGDSMLFVVSFWSEASKKREIKIFNLEGTLLCDGEPLPGLEKPIAWRPSGDLIALTQKLPNKHIVTFMEKNGLVHGNFTLPPETEVKELSWNIDSTILSVLCENKLLLFTVGNYHWYLKQQLDFSSFPVLLIRWDINAANLLHVFQKNGSYSVHQWSWNICHTPSLVDNDDALVAVIDGCKILLTSFKKKIIPPPMSDLTIMFSEPVNEVVFAPGRTNMFDNVSNCKQSIGCNVNDFIVYLYNKKLAFVHSDDVGPKVFGEFVIEKLEVDYLHHFTWLTPEILLCCGIKIGRKYFLCELNVGSDFITAGKHIALEQPVLSLASFKSSSAEAILQLVDGRLFRYSVGGDLSRININLLEPCCELNVYNSNVIALSELKRLYFNGELITSKATSFFIFSSFILVTTSEHTLFIYRINNLKCEQVGCRKLERGSKIVTVVNDNVILQMPRGNLETIQPRALTLHTAVSLISKCDYKKLFLLFRKHRINMNLIVDHQPQTFLLNVARFVQQIKDPSDLSLFLSELSDIDVTRGIYKEYYTQDERPPSLDKKVERVCQALRGVMITSGADETYYLNPIITTYVKTNDMNEALNFASRSSSCLKHLLFLVDVDVLYDSALGFYNLEMAMKIAEKSKKDPKEYVPYLNSLKKMDVEYMKYTIDCHFKKYESALRNISKSSNEDYFKEALSLIGNHKLYPLALQLYKTQPHRCKQVTVLFAEYLMLKHSYEEAAVMYSRCNKYEEAVNAYADAGLWRNAVVMATKIGYRSDEIHALGKRILPVLIRKGFWNEAASLCQEVLKDNNLVIEYLVQGKLWDKACYYASLLPNVQIESAVMPFVKEEANSILEIIKENIEKIKKHSARLSEVRQQKLKKKENPMCDIDVSDIQSDISSVSSYSSNTSRTGGTHSSKNTRKMQKKMWSLKEGNPREEFALLSVISQLIQDLEKLTDDVSKNSSALLYFNDDDFDNLALNLQTSLKHALKIVQEIRNVVWHSQANDNDLTAANELQDAQLKFPPSSCVKSAWILRVLDVVE